MERVAIQAPEALPATPGELKLKAEELQRDIIPAPSVSGVLIRLIRHPVEYLVRRWNWKSALLSSLLRAGIFFCANLVAGWHAALGAMLAELALRAVTSGFYGAITEAFAEARPTGAAMATAMVVLPFLNHSLEFLVHSLRGTPRLGLSIVASVGFTAVSTSFNVYAMREGVLTVGRGSKPLHEDLGRILPLLLRYLLAGPRALIQYLTFRRDSN